MKSTILADTVRYGLTFRYLTRQNVTGDGTD